MLTSPGATWKPATDEELTWFQPGGRFPTRPRPLDFTLEIQAFAFGFSRALESLYFPLYELRARRIDGVLYFGTAPSALAEEDLEADLRRLRDSALRFTGNIRGAWEQAIRREVAEYTDRFAAFPPEEAAGHEVAEGLRTLQRVRANQWFAPTRAVFAPAALLQEGIGQTPSEEAAAVVKEAPDLVDQGSDALRKAIARVAGRLVDARHLDTADDVVWLELAELRDAVARGGDRRAVVAERKASAGQPGAPGPATVGPALLADAPRMYLVRETLALIRGGA